MLIAPKDSIDLSRDFCKAEITAPHPFQDSGQNFPMIFFLCIVIHKFKLGREGFEPPCPPKGNLGYNQTHSATLPSAQKRTARGLCGYPCENVIDQC